MDQMLVVFWKNKYFTLQLLGLKKVFKKTHFPRFLKIISRKRLNHCMCFIYFKMVDKHQQNSTSPFCDGKYSILLPNLLYTE